MAVWLLGVPVLAGVAPLCGGDPSSVVLTAADYAVL